MGAAHTRVERGERVAKMITDRLENWRNYFSHPAWETVFTFLESLTPDSPEADFVSLQERDIYARIMSYDTKRVEDSSIEAHNDYIDIQMSLRGGEGIGWYPRAQLTPNTTYDAERDFVLFDVPAAPGAFVNNIPGQFAVLFQDDAHMPGVNLGDVSGHVKKVVVKLRAGLLAG